MPVDLLNGIYCGPAPDPMTIWLRWNLDPVLLTGLAVAALLLRRSITGVSAILVLAVAFVSPLCALSASLFSARVVHHVLLIAVAAPMLAMARPARKPVSSAVAFVPSVLALWIWHLPAAYDLALSNIAVYWIMQLTLLGTAFMYWQAAFHRQLGLHGPLLILAGYMQMALLGAILTFAPFPLYAIHAVAPLAWSFSALADQQLGGLIMWVPAGLPFMLFGGLLAHRRWNALSRQSGQPA
ncbi:MAG: cytochrome c oxidase assembly protein [Rhizobium sp.]|nr:cytochrome c oxidase assembly protein [Rhizobium sp.]